MLITGERLREIAGSFLATLDREGIKTLDDIVERLGKRLAVDESSGDYVQVYAEKIKPNRGIAYFLQYSLHGCKNGWPVITASVKSSHNRVTDGLITIGASKIVNGYSKSHLGTDNYGNAHQFRPIDGGIDKIRQELERLRDDSNLFG